MLESEGTPTSATDLRDSKVDHHFAWLWASQDPFFGGSGYGFRGLGFKVKKGGELRGVLGLWLHG